MTDNHISKKNLLSLGFNNYDSKGDSRYLIIIPDVNGYEIEIELSKCNSKIEYIWLNWDIGGGKKWVHLPKKAIPKNIEELKRLYLSLSGIELKNKNDN